MDIEEFRTFCLSLPGTEEDLKWGENLCFLVENKIFVLCNLETPIHICVKVDPEDFDQITESEGVQQAFHMAKRHWISINGFETLPGHKLQELVLKSRLLVIAKLSKKVQAKYN